jgi:hypothetical protein
VEKQKDAHASKIGNDYHLIALNNIKKLKGKMTDEEFETKTGVSVSTWQSWNKYNEESNTKNKGFRSIGLESALNIIKAFGVSLDSLFELETTMLSRESVSANLFIIIALILEGTITDWSIDDFFEDKTVIHLQNSMFEDFIDEYSEAIDFEDAVYKMIEDKHLSTQEASERKNDVSDQKYEILKKYIREYDESKKSMNKNGSTSKSVVDKNEHEQKT